MTRETISALALLLAGAAGVASLQPRLARFAHAAGEHEDVYALPPKEQLHFATLGWDAAAVDAIWASLLVEYGNHWAEHREFDETGRYADAILELEPTYRPLYRYIDTMMVYHPLAGTEKDARAARAYLQKGTTERPDDADLWLELGSFEAFIGGSYLTDPAEQETWRKEGGVAIAHAVELGASPERALTAASLLTQGGQAEVAIQYLERAYAFTEHPSMTTIHESIGRRIEALRQMQAAQRPPLPPPYR